VWRKSSHSGASDCAEVAAWRKSTASANNGACAEVGQAGTVVLVRDTEDRDGPWLAFPAAAWAAFLKGLRSA
jgi:hypothetical protein